MTSFKEKSIALFIFAIFLVTIYFSGSREAHWKIQYSIANSALAKAEKKLEIRDHNFIILYQELDEARIDRNTCNEVKDIVMEDTQKLAIMRREFASCRRSLKERAIVKNLHGN